MAAEVSQEVIDREARQVEMFKVKKLIKNLTAARGNGTSMISLVIPPKDVVSRVNKMLTDEAGTASNIKSRVNRLSVLGAITSTQQRLKLYAGSGIPPNGLVMYCGKIMTDEGKEKQVNIDFEPFKPINTSLYLCDNKFHTEALAVRAPDSARPRHLFAPTARTAIARALRPRAPPPPSAGDDCCRSLPSALPTGHRRRSCSSRTTSSASS